jgi:hypothetical protein
MQLRICVNEVMLWFLVCCPYFIDDGVIFVVCDFNRTIRVVYAFVVGDVILLFESRL